MKSRYHAFSGQDLVLFCYVDSTVPFTVTWSRGDTPLGDATKHIKSVNSSLWIPPNAFSPNDKFTCSARNIAGVTRKTTVVSVSSKFYLNALLPYFKKLLYRPMFLSLSATKIFSLLQEVHN